jgi:hypothetical protein
MNTMGNNARKRQASGPVLANSPTQSWSPASVVWSNLFPGKAMRRALLAGTRSAFKVEGKVVVHYW